MTDNKVAVIIPAYRAEHLIGAAVRSVLAQTYENWEIWFVADDGEDYEEILGRLGISDRRFHFLSTGRVGAGASKARNLALDRLQARFVAILDADDRMKPDKLARAVVRLAEFPVVSCALDVMNERYERLRLVGNGPDRVLDPASYKFVSLSMDSMILWDRTRTDARYDASLSNMTDLELLMQLWRHAPSTFHFGDPLHDYVKLPVSMSNGPNVTEGMINSKKTLLERLNAGRYRFAAPRTTEGLAAFLAVSLAAEAAYPMALAEKPGLLFEDHLEPIIRAYEAGSKPS